MGFEGRRPLRFLVPGLAWLGALVLGAYALRHPSPLVIDLGAGDEAVAGGFAEGWAHYDLRGKTTFRWTGDAASLALPADAEGRELVVEMRLARFADQATPISLTSGEHAIASWLQHPVGWRVRRFPAGAWSGPVSLQFSSPPSDGQPSGMAIDWCALRGIERVWPQRGLWLSLLTLLILAPLVVSLALRRSWPIAYGGPVLLAGLALWALSDTVAAATTALLAGPRVLVACVIALPVVLWIGRRSGEAEGRGQRAFVCVPALVLLLALCALSNPRYHYPDVDTHARFLAGMREQPHWALDPREYQQRTRAWTRLIGERFVGFPYSTAFHVLAWPLAPALGEVGAVKTLGVMGVAIGLVLVYRLGRAARATPATAVLAQALFAMMPVVPSRLTLALLPSLLGQAMELWLLLALATRFSAFARWRDRLAALLLIFAVQLTYTGSLYNVAFVVTLLFAVGLATDRARAALWLLAAYSLAAIGVALLQYRHFAPMLVSDLLPHLGAASATVATPGEAVTPLGVLTHAGERLWIFFGPFGLALAAIGWIALAKMAWPARRVLFVALGAGLLLALLRPALPVLFSDAKEVELLAGPMSIAVSLGIAWTWSQRRAMRIAAIALAAALVAWSVLHAIGLYASRLTWPPGA